MEQKDSIPISGVVLDPAGQPASGATIMIVKPPDRTSRAGIKVQPAQPGCTADAQGQFQLTLGSMPCHLVALKPGFGLDFTLVTAENAKRPLKLQLGNEMPVQGQVFDEAKQPVENATVGVTSIRRFTPEALEDGMEQIRQTGDNNAPYRTDVDYLLVEAGSLVTARSDSTGRFTLRGLPVGALSHLTYAKPGLVSKSVMVALIPGFDKEGSPRHKLTASMIDDALLKRSGQYQNETVEETRKRHRQLGYGREYEGATLDLAMRKGVTLEGTVRNLQGQPVAGISLHALGGSNAVSDQDGRYVLRDVQPGENYLVQTATHDRYLVAQASAVHRSGGPIRIDVLVRPGAILRGKVIDSKTGQGVRSFINVKPTPGNPLLNKPNVLHECSITTEPGGTFQLVAPPGDIIVTASPDTGSRSLRPMPFIPAKILPSHSGLINSGRGGEDYVTFQHSGQVYRIEYAYQLLELPAEGETTVELTMTRGQERPLHLTDPQGKPIEKSLIAGLDQAMTPFMVEGATQTVVGLTASERARQLFILNKERTLGAFLTLNKNESGPLTVQLNPVGSYSARLIDAEGKPREGTNVGLRPELSTDRTQTSDQLKQTQQMSMLKDFFPTVSTDHQGRFTISEIIPNMNSRLYSVSKNVAGLPFNALTNPFQLDPGEHRNDGDLKMTNPSRPRNFGEKR